MMSGYLVRRDCRLCGHDNLELSLSLTPTPPANEFVSSDAVGISQDEFPLVVYTCRSCGHVQLPIIVDPSRLFRNYVYVSGTSPVFVDHFRRYAEDMISRFGLKPGDLVVDIGSNDGTLLRFFRDAGMMVIGVDPAIDIATKATSDGIPTMASFFNKDAASIILSSCGPAKLVLANNVFAHADDLVGLAKSVNSILDPSGAFVFEVSYLVDVINKLLFDTIYHEHLSYHSVGPLIKFFDSIGMTLFDVERIPTHGGSIRGYACPKNRVVSSRVAELQQLEHDMGLIPPILNLKSSVSDPVAGLKLRIEELRLALRHRINEIKAQGKKIAGFGAPAKTTTLMYHLGLGADDLDFIVDDSPLKQGLFTPGKHIPVLSSAAIETENPDYLVILAWNFADSIIAKNQAFRDRGGKFIIPLPTLMEV